MTTILQRLAVLFFTLAPIPLYTQVTLQPWMEVYGTTNGQQLGKFVTGIVPTSNFPYKASVSKVGSTSVYLLQTQTDTVVRRVLIGENLSTGDLNNDGYTDVVANKEINGYDTVFVYWGTEAGIDTLDPLEIAGENRLDSFGARVIGDVNNDGYPDLVCSAPGYSDPFGYGKVYFFLGPSITVTPNRVLLGDTVRAHLGVVAVGDLNSDGLNDLVVGGLSTLGSQSQWYKYLNINLALVPDSIPLHRSTRLLSSDSRESGIAVLDANGDGIDDLLWAIRDSQATRINLHFGRTMFDTVPDLQLQNPGVGTFGSVITNGGDMNGDGYNDIVVGCPHASITSGIVLVYGGGPQIDAHFDAAVSRGSESYFGRSVSGLGDINGDGFADIIVGGPHDPFFNDRGYWGVFLGDSRIRVTGVREDRNLPDAFVLRQAFPNPFNPVTSIEYELKTSAFVTIEVFDLLGERVASLVGDEKDPGNYTTLFDGSRYAGGMYLYRMSAKTGSGTVFTDTKRMLLIK